MLLIDIYRYLRRRADKRPVYLKNFVDQSHHHGTRTEDPFVSIIIPTRDRIELLRACVESVLAKTNYKNYEIVIVDNQSKDLQTHQYFDDLIIRGVRMIKYPKKFNYSAICNLAAANSDAEYLCFLNNDTEVIEPDWLGCLIDHAVQPLVGVVGPRLQNVDGSTQSLGLIKGLRGVASHFTNSSKVEAGRQYSCMGISALSFACVIVSRSLFSKLGSLDEKYATGLNDVDFCDRSLKNGFQNTVCFQASVEHIEYGTRPRMKNPKGFVRAIIEVARYLKEHSDWAKDGFFEMR